MSKEMSRVKTEEIHIEVFANVWVYCMKFNLILDSKKNKTLIYRLANGIIHRRNLASKFYVHDL